MKHTILRNRLKKKGWKDEELDHTFATFLRAEEKKHPLLKKLDKNIIWVAIFLIILINIFVTLSLIPVYLTMPTFYVAILLAILGLIFGFLTDLAVREIEHYSHHHYFIAGVLVPLSSLIAMYYALRLSNVFSIYFKSSVDHNLFLLSCVYFVSFSLPHFINKHKEISEINAE